MVISASLQACGVVFPFAMLTSICRSIVTICSGLYLLIGMTSFSSKWILSHSTWYKFRRSRQFDKESIRAMKESAVFDKPHVKKSAWVGAENFPDEYSKSLRSFSLREFPAFSTREEALAWLVKD
jgi:hypothetical protein